MTTPGFDVTQILRDKLAEQPFYKKYANTVTSAVGLLVGAIWLLISTGVELPEDVTKGALIVIALLTTLGVYKTPNGVTEKQITEIEDYVGKHRAG